MRSKFRPAIGVIAGLAATGLVLSATAASAAVDTDPPQTPPAGDIVGVGSDTTQDVIGLDGSSKKKSGFVENYNATDPDAKLWSFDAFGDPASIVTSEGCAPITRPNGSSAGVAALKLDQEQGTGCIDYARSSRPKNPATDGNLVFVPFARDGVTWGTFPTKPGGKKFNAPSNLTTAQLAEIYQCTITNWNQVGGKNAPIKAFLPQSGSGTRSFFLGAIGVATPGACVTQGIPENDGSAVPSADRKNAVLPYSIAKHIAQSKKVGDDLRAGVVLRDINGTKPVLKKKLNESFTPAFLRLVFNVLKPEDVTKPEFEAIFATDGYICSNSKITQTFGFGKLSGAACGY